MITSLYTADVKLNKTDKNYKRVIIIMNSKEGVLIVENTLFVLSFDSFEEFKKEIDYNDIRHIGDVNI